MRKLFSLPLTALLIAASLVLTALPARAQRAAQQTDSVSKLDASYRKLLAVEQDPSTPPDIRRRNRVILEARRAQLAAEARKSLAGWRKYRAEMKADLSKSELASVDGSIRKLERLLAELKPAAAGGEADEPRAQAASQTPAPPRRRQTRVMMASLNAAAAPTPETEETPEPEESPEPEETPESPKIKFLAPDDAEVTTKVSQYEVKLEVPTNVDEIEVSVTPKDKKAVTQKFTMRPSDEGKKSVVVMLAKGENTVAAVNPKEAAHNATPVKITYEPDDAAVVGPGVPQRAVSGIDGLSYAPGDPARFFERPTPGENVRVSYEGERGQTYQFLRNFQNVGNPVVAGFNGVASTIFPTVEEGDAIGVMVVDDGQSQPNTYAEIRVERGITNDAVQNEGGPVGLLVGGAVLSQQAGEFQQSDPFFGFIAGYRSKLRGKVPKLTATGVADGKRYIVLENGALADADGYLIESRIDGTPRLCDAVEEPQCFKDKDFTYVIERNSAGVPRRVLARQRQLYPKERGFSGGWRWNLRFQGVFDAAPRTATATADDSDNGGGGETPAQDPFKFIASRKSFDVQAHGSVDFWPRNFFSIGPYVAWGAHTVLDRNELEGETVSPDENADGETDDDEVRSRARSDNDIKQYQEAGLTINLDLFNRNLFIQNILAYGRYEGLKDLDPGDATNPGNDTRNRFIGRLRIFPGGLNKRFGSIIRPIPMFGVDLNAGNGPDHLKFFTGFALGIRGITP
ncbi:MAG TPA: hypothetical protein VER32_00755 [Pyrinomonadaceae bacterium]|nr:hypothetical protein [Pyrinomonadaceae bacterium]